MSERVAKVILDAGGLDVSACEAAGLAHDLGHPPFGHAGETRLDAALRQVGKDKSLAELDEGFEGNAQSFRIVTFLDLKSPGRRGLDLTNVTLAAIQKYPRVRQANSNKFGAYASERSILERCRQAILGPGWERDKTQTLEASVMDLADDIAYAVHDLEDFCGSGLIDLRLPISDLDAAIQSYDRAPVGFKVPPAGNPTPNPFSLLSAKLAKDYSGYYSPSEMRAAFEWTAELIEVRFPAFPRAHSEEYLASIRQELSEVIAWFFDSIKIQKTRPYSNGPRVFLDSPTWHQLQCLKLITRTYLVDSPQMGVVQRSQTQSIQRLFYGLAEWLEQYPEKNTIPAALKDFIEANDEVVPERKQGSPPIATLTARHYRAIVDYICGMSDSEAATRSQWVAGGSVASMIGLGD